MDTSEATRTPTNRSMRENVLTTWLAGVLTSLAWTIVAALLASAAAYFWLAGAVQSHVGVTEGPWSFPSVYVTISPDPFPLAVMAIFVWGLGLALIGGLCWRRMRQFS